MMRNKIAVLIMLLFAFTLLLCACGAAEKLTEYDFGPDKIPSVNAVIGETRKVTGLSTGTSNGVRYKEYTYITSTMVEDLAEYSGYLRSIGWLVINDYNFTTGSGEARLATESADSGMIIIVSITFEASRYTIRINKLEGELTPK